jgi:plasmid maintenance system antidote protein VapI
MQLVELLREENVTAADMARRIGCGRAHLSHVMAGRKPLSRALAIRIYRQTGRKVEPIANIDDSDIDVLERVG